LSGRGASRLGSGYGYIEELCCNVVDIRVSRFMYGSNY